jgi:heme/copper-type cytochrome/quinol oxidase subunit 2
MENTVVSKHTTSFGLSLALCALLNALLVIAKERSKNVADWMQNVTGHHWITHVAIILFLFAIFGWCFSRTNGGQGPNITVNRLTRIVFSGVFAGVLIVLAFYVIAD